MVGRAAMAGRGSYPQKEERWVGKCYGKGWAGGKNDRGKTYLHLRRSKPEEGRHFGGELIQRHVIGEKRRSSRVGAQKKHRRGE